MRRLITPVVLLCLVYCLLPGITFAQKPTAFYNHLSNFFQTGTGQKHTTSAASGTEKLSFRFSSLCSNTPGMISNTNYKVLNFYIQVMIEASAKIACLTVSEKQVQPIKICTLERTNYLITKPILQMKG